MIQRVKSSCFHSQSADFLDFIFRCVNDGYTWIQLADYLYVLSGLASVCSSRSPLPALETDHSSSVKSRTYSPPPSPYPKRRTSTSSGETMNHSYQSPRLGNRDSYDRRIGVYTSNSRDRSGSSASTSGM